MEPQLQLQVRMTAKKKKTPAGVLKRLSIAELEVLDKTDANKLKTAVNDVLLAKKILQKVREKYEKL